MKVIHRYYLAFAKEKSEKKFLKIINIPTKIKQYFDIFYFCYKFYNVNILI